MGPNVFANVVLLLRILRIPANDEVRGCSFKGGDSGTVLQLLPLDVLGVELEADSVTLGIIRVDSRSLKMFLRTANKIRLQNKIIK